MAPGPELVGVGSPIMDLTARVSDDFLRAHVAGEKGGMVLVDAAGIDHLTSLLPAPPTPSPGGSAANVIVAAARLGIPTAFVGKVGNDGTAATYRSLVTAAGVDGSRLKTGDRANARCLVMVTPDAQRTMRTDLGAALTLAPGEIHPADFSGARHAHIEGYLVFNQDLADAALDAASAAGCTVSLDLSSFEVVAASRTWLRRRLAHGIDIVFANEDETRAYFQDASTPFGELAREFAASGVTAVVKVGSDGAWIARGGELVRIPPAPVERVVDTNGAGDAFAAGFLAAWLRGLDLAAAGSLGARLGAACVQHFGAGLPDHAWPALREALPT